MSPGPPRGSTAPATHPPADLPGLDPSWSRLVTATDADGRTRTWHVLDSAADTSDGGSRGTVLCVHGNPTWSYLWRDVVACAPTGWRVVAVDQLDMGYSERTRTLRTLDRRIDDLDRLVGVLAPDGPVITVAHDWGGPIALGWGLRHPDRLAGIVLLNTAVQLPDHTAGPVLIRGARTPGVLDTVCVRTPTFIRGTTALANPPLSRAVRDAYAAPYDTAGRRHAVGAFVRDIPLTPGHRSAATLRAIADGLERLSDVPALLIWGARDPVFSDAYLHDLEDRLPQAHVHRDATAGHLVAEDLDVAGILQRWVGELAADEIPAPVDGTAPGPVRTPTGERRPLWAVLEDPDLHDRPAVVEVVESGRPRPADRQVSGPGPRTMTFGELARNVRSLAAGLSDHGVRHGDRVALLIEPGADLATTVSACWRLGAVVVVADAGLGARGITHALRSAAPDHLIAIPRALAAARLLRWPGRRFVAGELPAPARRMLGVRASLAELVRDGADLPVPAPPDPQDDAAIVFTSGATGPAKGVAYRHHQIEAQRDALARTYAITPDDRLVAAFAPFALYGPLLGITSVVPDMDVTSPGTLRATALAQAVAAIDATLVFAAPAALANVAATAGDLTAEQKASLGRVRLLLSAGAPVPTELLRKLTRLLPGAEPHTPYGMTEALPVADISLQQLDDVGDGNGVCVGRPIAGVEVAISPLDDAGAANRQLTRTPGITGEIAVRAAHVKDRYDRLWATQALSARDHGWHRSGDVGHLDVDGRLWVEGRLVHVITTADGVVTPVAIERRAESLDEVVAAAAVGVGPIGTQQVVVVVVPASGTRRGGVASQELTDAIRETVATDIAAVLVAPSLPVDIRHNSKIDRTRMADWAAAVLAGGRAGAP